MDQKLSMCSRSSYVCCFTSASVFVPAQLDNKMVRDHLMLLLEAPFWRTHCLSCMYVLNIQQNSTDGGRNLFKCLLLLMKNTVFNICMNLRVINLIGHFHFAPFQTCRTLRIPLSEVRTWKVNVSSRVNDGERFGQIGM